jgi:hypothetical protein
MTKKMFHEYKENYFCNTTERAIDEKRNNEYQISEIVADLGNNEWKCTNTQYQQE